MELVLVVVTLMSLALASGMAIVAWTLLRAERQRSAAQVEALQALAFDEQPVAPTQRDRRPSPATTPDLPRDVATSDHHGEADVLDEVDPQTESWDLALKNHRDAKIVDEGDPGDVVHGRHRPDDMFERAPVAGVAGRRWLAAATAAALAIAAVAIASVVRSPEFFAAVSASPPTAVADVRSGPLPIELLSLRHATDADGGFTVTGFVQNPPGGSELGAVDAVVYLFDDDGQYFASGRAGLDVAAVEPGGESPFVVTVSNAGHVGRYRVGFRKADGGVVAHVDHRGQVPAGTTGDTLVVEPAPPMPAGGMEPDDRAGAR